MVLVIGKVRRTSHIKYPIPWLESLQDFTSHWLDSFVEGESYKFIDYGDYTDVYNSKDLYRFYNNIGDWESYWRNFKTVRISYHYDDSKTK